jgi:protein-disulfide isomerase
LDFRDFPLREIHPQAQIAAEAARCACDQGKFWEFHDALFADQSKLDEAALIAQARVLGLNERSFQSCLTSGKFKAKIEETCKTEAGWALPGLLDSLSTASS